MPTKTFPLDKVLGAGSAATLELSGTTSMDVVTAVAGRRRMPTRPDGVLELGAIGLSLSSGEALRFTAGATRLDISFGAGVSAGLGVYDVPGKALAALDLDETPGLEIAIDDPDDTRFVLLRAGYSASGGVTGTHPIGAIGRFAFGVSGKASGVTAVLQAFDDSEKTADAVLGDVAKSWRLPRHVTAAEDLAPRTWLVAEAEGSVAVRLSAQVGYDFSFVREVKAAGLSGDIGLEIDAAAKATFGLDVSGRYLVVVGRESDDHRVRVRMFKLARRGAEFGLNLEVGVQGVETLTPGKVDDFVKAVFGVHGAQVVAALARLEQWTDPETSVGELVAGLANEKALELIEEATGVDPKAAFEAARGKLTGAIQLWRQLPERVASEVLGILGGLDEAGVEAFRGTLAVLASNDETEQRAEIAALLDATGFDDTPAGRVLLALADRGLTTLLGRLPEVRRTARIVADLLDGDVLRRLQSTLARMLNLDRLVDHISRTDFEKLDSFLVGRLAAFLDRDVGFEQIDEIRETIHVVLAKRQEIYAKARKALTTRYGAEIAATWQRTSSKTALLDVEIDTAGPAGRRLLGALLRDGDLDGLLTSPSRVVTFHTALLTHELKRKSTLQVTLPKMSFRIEHANSSLAGVSVHEDGGRLLLYQVDASDVVTDTRRRYRSSLVVGLSTEVAAGSGIDLRVHGSDRASWSYQLLHARSGMQRGELEMYTRPFLQRYMTDRFGEQQRWGQWFTELDRTVEGLLANGPDRFGDVLLEMQVSMPSEALRAWMRPQADLRAASKAVSLAIQRALRMIIPFYYFQDPDQLHQNASAAALFVWSAIPTVTSARLDGSRLVLESGKGVYWDQRDRDLRVALSHHPVVPARLGQQFASIRARLLEVRRQPQADFFTAEEVPDWIAAAVSEVGDRFLLHLCQFEARVIAKAVDALENIQAFLALRERSPSKAIDRLADFGADITMAFNTLDTVYAKAPLRSVTQGVFIDASRALALLPPGGETGMLTLTVLEPEGRRTFELASYLAGETPKTEDILLQQRLVSGFR
jgi:hypothetical protein